MQELCITGQDEYEGCIKLGFCETCQMVRCLVVTHLILALFLLFKTQALQKFSG